MLSTHAYMNTTGRLLSGITLTTVTANQESKTSFEMCQNTKYFYYFNQFKIQLARIVQYLVLSKS